MTLRYQNKFEYPNRQSMDKQSVL